MYCQNASFFSRSDVLVLDSVGLLEVGLTVFGVGNHRGLARLPASGTDLAVLVRELEGLHQSEALVHVTTHWEIIDGYLPQLP